MTYIEREALGIGKANREVFENPAYADGWNAAIDIIEAAPAADVAPVKHGRWISVDGTPLCDEWDCSACNGRRTYMDVMSLDDMQEFYAYCPLCGAKMDLED